VCCIVLLAVHGFHCLVMGVSGRGQPKGGVPHNDRIVNLPFKTYVLNVNS